MSTPPRPSPNTPPPSDELQALAAGYVLGDLSSEEMADFQARLATDADLAQMVDDLQATLSLLPYGLPQQSPGAAVRARLLQAAQQQAVQQHFPQEQDPKQQTTQLPHPPSRKRFHRPSHRPWGTYAASSVAALFCGCSLWLWSENIQLNIRLAATERLLNAHTQLITTAQQSSLTISPAESETAALWSASLTHLIQDHTAALMASDQVAEDDWNIAPLPAAMPTLVAEQAALMSSSPCQFGKTQGFRTTYQLGEQHAVSVYRINLQGNQFPQLPSTQVTLNQDGIRLLLWKEKDYLYAIAGAMPLNDLQTLTKSLEVI